MSEKTKICPFCGEEIKEEAIKCRFCEEFLFEKTETVQKEPCPFCGEDIDKNISICPFCDSELKTTLTQKQKKDFIPEGSAITGKLKNISRRNLCIIGVICVAVFCGVLILSLIGTGKKSKRETVNIDMKTFEEVFDQVEDMDLPPGRPDFQLLEYTELGDLRAVKYLVLKCKANVNGAYNTKTEESALHIALRKNFNDIAKFLIRKGADVNYKAKGNSAFIYPLSNNDQEMMTLLLKYNAEKILGAVLFAVMERNADLLKYLLEQGFEPNVCYTDSDGNSALHLAVESNFIEGVSLLLKHNADVDIVNKKDETVLHKWIKNGNPEIFKMLRKEKIPLDFANSDGNTPLMILVSTTDLENEKTNFQMIKMLVEAGASVMVKDKNGLPLLSKTSAPKVLEYLLKLKVPVVAHKDDLRLLNLKYRHNNFSDKELSGIVEILFRCGVNPNSESRYRSEYNDILAFSVKNCYPETLKILLKYGIKKRSGLYSMLLSDYQYQRNPEKATKYSRFLDILIEHKIPVSTKDFESVDKNLPGKTAELLESECPLPEEIWFNVIESSQAEKLIPLLLKRNSNLNVKNSYNETPLIWAIKRNPKIAKLLINNGADVNYHVTETPLKVAIDKNNPELVSMLLKHGAKNTSSLKEVLRAKKFGIAKVLLEYGADPNINRTPYALFDNHDLTDEECLQYVRLLAKYKTDFFTPHKDRVCWIKSSYSQFSATMNFFDMAALCGYLKTIEYIRNNLTPDKDPSSICLYLYCTDPAVKNFLLKNKIGIRGWLLKAIPRLSAESLCEQLPALVNAGLDINEQGNGNALHYVLKTSSIDNYYGKPKILRELIKHGIDVNAKDSAGKTPLFYAVQLTENDCCYILLKAGAIPTKEIADRAHSRGMQIAVEDSLKKLEASKNVPKKTEISTKNVIKQVVGLLNENKYDQALLLLAKYENLNDPQISLYTGIALILSRKDSKKGIELLKTSADAGILDAMIWLGQIYFGGLDGFPKDLILAEKYFQQAAAKNNAYSMYYLALLYIQKKDDKKALEYLTESTKLGDPNATFVLATYYLNQPESAKWREGVKLLMKIPDFREAKTLLGFCYLRGKGIEKNSVKAKELLEKAAAEGSVDAQKILKANFK